MSAPIAPPAVEIISTTYYVCYQRPVEWLHSTGALLLLLFLCYPATVQCIDAPLHRLPALSVVCARSLARSLYGLLTIGACVCGFFVASPQVVRHLQIGSGQKAPMAGVRQVGTTYLFTSTSYYNSIT